MNDTAFDILLTGGTVIENTRNPRFDGAVEILQGRIAATGDLVGCTAREVIDASGKIVAPGFIDSPMQDDHAVLFQPDMLAKITIKRNLSKPPLTHASS